MFHTFRHSAGSFVNAETGNLKRAQSSWAIRSCGHLEQADGTAWMALFSQNMAEIAAELATYDRSYEEFVVKFAAAEIGAGHLLNLLVLTVCALISCWIIVLRNGDSP